MQRTNRQLMPVMQVAFMFAVFVILGVIFSSYFSSIDTTDNSLGIDNIFNAFEDWDIHYQVDEGLRNPPWSVLPLVPLGQLDRQVAWGWLVYLTIIIIVASVPRSRRMGRYGFAVLIAVISFPSLRNIADANLEGILIAGAALTVAGYNRHSPLVLAAGLVFITVKPQACFVLLPILALYILQTWPRESWLKAAAITLAVVIPTFLWRGGDWLQAIQGTYQAGSIIDISLSAALNRAGIGTPIIVWPSMAAVLIAAVVVALRGNRTLSREKATMLMATSMLLAPYVAGNSMISVLVIGVIPYFLRHPRPGLVLIALYNVPYLFLADAAFRQNNIAYWWTFTLLITWATFLWHIWKTEIATRSDTRAQSPTETARASQTVSD